MLGDWGKVCACVTTVTHRVHKRVAYLLELELGAVGSCSA